MKLTPSMGILTTKHENLQPNRHQKEIVRGRKNVFSLIYQKQTINHLEAQKLGNLNPNGNGKRLISALGLSTLTIQLRSFKQPFQMPYILPIVQMFHLNGLKKAVKKLHRFSACDN